MMVYRGIRGTALPILNLGRRWIWVVNFKPRSFCPPEKNPGTHWIVGRPQSWCGSSGRETSLALVGVRIPDGLARILITIRTDISQFLNTMGQYFKIGRDRFPPHAFRFTSHSLPPTPRHKARSWSSGTDVTVTQILLSPSSAKQPTFSQKTCASPLLRVRTFVASDRPF